MGIRRSLKGEGSAAKETALYAVPDSTAVHPAADILPLLSESETNALAADIRQRGLINPIVYTVDGLLLDGRNRLRACLLAGVEPRSVVYRGDDPVGYVVAQNVRRRQLTTGQLAFAAAALKPLYAAEAKERERERKQAQYAGVRTVADPPQSSSGGKSRDRAAAVVGSTGRHVATAERLTRDAPDLAEQVRSGVLPLDRAERISRDRRAERARVVQARADRRHEGSALRVDVRCGDFREVLADVADGSIDAIITDPPYSKEYLPLYADLAKFADRVLTPDGVLAVLVGQTWLPEVYQALAGHRPYRWTACLSTPRRGYVSHPRKVQSNWKPVVVYGGGPRFVDVISSDGSDDAAKDLHCWGQDYGAFTTLVERLTRRGETVCDPMCGGGTTIVAAHTLGRHSIGSDVDPASVATTMRRVGLEP